MSGCAEDSSLLGVMPLGTISTQRTALLLTSLHLGYRNLGMLMEDAMEDGVALSWDFLPGERSREESGL